MPEIGRQRADAFVDRHAAALPIDQCADTKLCLLCGIPHNRHTFGTRMAAAGVPMCTLQERMGHRDIETTQRYADYAPSAPEAELIAAAFGTIEAAPTRTA